MNFLTEVNYSLFIWSVCTFVESHVREEINMEELARQTGFSPVYVREVFRRRTGKPLARYIQERKIANAAQELLYTDRKIIDIAIRYGYSGKTACAFPYPFSLDEFPAAKVMRP